MNFYCGSCNSKSTICDIVYLFLNCLWVVHQQAAAMGPDTTPVPKTESAEESMYWGYFACFFPFLIKICGINKFTFLVLKILIPYLTEVGGIQCMWNRTKLSPIEHELHMCNTIKVNHCVLLTEIC